MQKRRLDIFLWMRDCRLGMVRRISSGQRARMPSFGVSGEKEMLDCLGRNRCSVWSYGRVSS
ncbi:hypothetical protein Scep_024970 [Stephania cephalantha]|uniref:Uncharacterized protein n=1 Tax=Stephania cephalantha TaxID=152367 RepID=A0AAP0F0B3_9MAGN